MRWIVTRLPGGGATDRRPEWEDEAINELLDGFLDSLAGAPYAKASYRDMLLERCETGCGEPLRWSAHRVTSILRDRYEPHFAPEISLDAPALLRAFIPFVHVENGIGNG